MINENIIDVELLREALKGTYGLERETLRVDEDGFLAETCHIFKDKHIDRDFCESQVEIISPVCNSIDELYESIGEIDRFVKTNLDHEYLWMFSNPPYVKSEDSIHIAQYDGELRHKTEYREYLAEKYGKRKMLFCGIHYNYGYSDEFIKLIAKKQNRADVDLLRNEMYLSLSQKIEQYTWLIVFLTAASPIFDGSFAKSEYLGETYFTGEASMRSGDDGYWNDFVPIIDYTSIDSYVNSVNKYVRSGKLASASEWYTPVRIKPVGENSLENLQKNGANHIELRMLDVNPLFDIGIDKTDLEFIKLFLFYLTFTKCDTFDENEQLNAVYNHKAAALFNVSNLVIKLHDKEVKIEDCALDVLSKMDRFFNTYKLNDISDEVIAIMKERCKNPSARHSHIVYDYFKDDFVEKGMALMKYYLANPHSTINDFKSEGQEITKCAN